MSGFFCRSVYFIVIGRQISFEMNKSWDFPTVPRISTKHGETVKRKENRRLSFLVCMVSIHVACVRGLFFNNCHLLGYFLLALNENVAYM